MEQRDYILREIEKIGLILNAIRRKLFGGKAGSAFAEADAAADTETDKEMEPGIGFSELGIEMDTFLPMDTADTDKYLSQIKGMNVENIELLADCLVQMGSSDMAGHGGNESSSSESALNDKYLIKALQLYHLCNLKSSTYSFSRERKILMIENEKSA
ncbi:MAG: hypothetical protein CVT93_01400 [Bacteroidetes bacterium HGW-Bacteroidetes-10]|nr:MAG: hypothetical protein CVT93_01400 [Bacteroidetes bacterium HGW-Bacteroidetes-10]